MQLVAVAHLGRVQKIAQRDLLVTQLDWISARLGSTGSNCQVQKERLDQRPHGLGTRL